MRAASTERQLLELLVRATPPRDEFGPAPAHGPAPAYALPKAAPNAPTRARAARHRRHGGHIWFGAVCPGDVNTRMCTAEEPEEVIEPDEAAADVLWLLRRAALSRDALPSGRFWRRREQISF